MKKIGMIGVGNMGGAILRGMIASGYVAAEDVMAQRGKASGTGCGNSGADLHDGCQGAGARVPYDCAGGETAGTGRTAGQHQG